MEQRYIVTDSSGWLSVKLEPGRTIVPIPQYIRVSFYERRGGRDYFQIEEGAYQGRSASVSVRTSSSSWLGKPLPPYTTAIALTFQKEAGKLSTPIGELRATTDSSNPIDDGDHPVQLPDFPHDLGRGYLSRASKAMTWFYLGRGNAVPGNNDRYIHPGRISAGCVTVTEFARWDALYEVLILGRAPGGRNVGTITVQR